MSTKGLKTCIIDSRLVWSCENLQFKLYKNQTSNVLNYNEYHLGHARKEG